MSESDLSDAPSHKIPSKSELEAKLRAEVRRADKAGEEYTVRTVRTAVEELLDLPDGYFKTEWSDGSKVVIQEEAQDCQTASSKPKSDSKTPRKDVTSSSRSSKRKSPEADAQPKKKSKTSETPVKKSSAQSTSSTPAKSAEKSMSSNTESKKLSSGSKSKRKPTAKKDADIDSEESSSGDESVDQADDDISDSEMSVVLDDKPERKKSKSDESSKKSKSSNPSKGQTDNDPDKEEIKKLQGQLAKCGIRKVWGKELKPYETSKAKIKHLRHMLSDIGMSGRFSNEKAAQIREARELAADIEAVQEGAQRWGKSDDDESGNEDAARSRGGRKLTARAKVFDFLSSDGEETD